tara:strand:+ start:738 stop:980 length:243 start_codon:yes stop_codon:yes gene_type:complete
MDLQEGSGSGVVSLAGATWSASQCSFSAFPLKSAVWTWALSCQSASALLAAPRFEENLEVSSFFAAKSHGMLALAAWENH